MTSEERPGTGGGDGTDAEGPARATIRTRYDDPGTAALVAAAVAPDDTAAIDTRRDGTAVVTTIDRDSAGGLRSSVDDYVVNLAVAARVARLGGADVQATTSGPGTGPTDTSTRQ